MLWPDGLLSLPKLRSCHILVYDNSLVCNRSAQKAGAAAAAEESLRLRRLAAQEAWLRTTFLEAVEQEKERVLLARQQHTLGTDAGRSAVLRQVCASQTCLSM